MSAIHFSPRPNRAHEIDWHEWNDAAFAAAQTQDKPVLLGISVVWCHWRHVMDETSYSDPAVIRLINERFIAIRVDNDQRTGGQVKTVNGNTLSQSKIRKVQRPSSSMLTPSLR